MTSTWRRHRAARAGARRTGGPPRPASLHHGDDGAAGQGSARHRHRRSGWSRSGAPSGNVVRTVATARWGRRRGIRWRGRSSAAPTSARWSSSRSGSRARPATCCWCWPPARGCRRTSARRSARSGSCAASGWTVSAAGMARGLRGVDRRRRADQPVPRARRRHPLRSRVVRVSRHRRASCSTTCRCAARRRGRRHRRRERRRQDHAGEAAGEDVRADVGRDSRRRRRRWRACRPRSGARGCAGAFQDFFRFEFLARQTVGLGDVPRLDDEPAVVGAVDRAGAERRRLAAARRDSTRSSARPGPAASTCRSGNGRSWRSRAASCATIRCCWCSTSRPRRSMPRPSTRCSSATRRRARPPIRRRSITLLRLAPVLHGADGGYDRGAVGRGWPRSARTKS